MSSPAPHVGGPITMGWPTVQVGGQDAATMACMCTCTGPPDVIVSGSPTVLILGLQAARMTDMTAHGGLVAAGFANVMIGIDPFLESIIAGVNPSGSSINCGRIIDAVWARLKGTDPNANVPNQGDGSFDDIDKRFGTNMQWGKSFDEAFAAVQAGGPGTTAIVGVQYSNGNSHVIMMTNQNGNVAITEAQPWGGADSPEVINNPARANQRYNSDGKSDIGYTIIPGSSRGASP
jgi:uncharacterized Zn-binding protein involved in type VI secretion